MGGGDTETHWPNSEKHQVLRRCPHDLLALLQLEISKPCHSNEDAREASVH